MIDAEIELATRLKQLRDSFDLTFTMPHPGPAEQGDEFVIAGTGEGYFGLQLNALSGLVKARKIVPLPVRAVGLLGLAGFHGRMIPVFSLSSLLGYGSGTGLPSWCAVCKAEENVGVAFDRFHGSVHVKSGDVYEEEADAGKLQIARRSFRLETGIVRIVDVAAAVALACERLRES